MNYPRGRGPKFDEERASSTERQAILEKTRINSEEFMSETATTVAMQKHSALGAIIRGGTLCGVLDTTAAFGVYGGFFGVNPLLILQEIASGILGSRAFDGRLRFWSTLGWQSTFSWGTSWYRFPPTVRGASLSRGWSSGWSYTSSAWACR